MGTVAKRGPQKTRHEPRSVYVTLTYEYMHRFRIMNVSHITVSARFSEWSCDPSECPSASANNGSVPHKACTRTCIDSIVANGGDTVCTDTDDGTKTEKNDTCPGGFVFSVISV